MTIAPMPRARFRKKMNSIMSRRREALKWYDGYHHALQLIQEMKRDPTADIELVAGNHMAEFIAPNPNGWSNDELRAKQLRVSKLRKEAIQTELLLHAELKRAMKQRARFPLGLLRKLLASRAARARLQKINRRKKQVHKQLRQSLPK